MKINSRIVWVIALIMAPAYAHAAPIIDGNFDASYGSPTAHVTFDALAPDDNFTTPSIGSNTSPYAIWLTSDANYVYGFLSTSVPTGKQYANLYFNTVDGNGHSSDFGIEVNNDRVFIPGKPGYASLAGYMNTALSSDGKSIEFSIANAAFKTALPGLDYYDSIFPNTGDQVTLTLSQSFGKTVVGGPLFGPGALGRVTLGSGSGDVISAVPEPEMWAMLLLGLGVIGFALRLRTHSMQAHALA